MASFQDTVAILTREGGLFNASAPVFVARSPGRLDLMGGNDDYTGGLVFEMTIREATWAATQVREDGQIVLRNQTAAQMGWKENVRCALNLLVDEQAVRKYVNASPDIRWTAYVLGNFHYLLKKYAERITDRGMTVYIESNVPLNKGVSSSAAVEVAVMKAACAAYGIDLTGVGLALACQWVENVIAESACGVMDQITAVLGDEGCVLPLVCQPCNPEPLVRLPASLECWAIDSGASHEVSGIEYEAARAAAFMGYKLICDLEGLDVVRDDSQEIPRYTEPRWNGYLANLPRALFHEQYEHRLPETMTGEEYLGTAGEHVDPFTRCLPEYTYRIRANTRYAVEENQRVQLFAELARGATTERAFRLLGDLMCQSHYAYTECGLASEATDRIVALARQEGPENGVYGAKITGGGAGGTVAILAKKDARPAVERLVARYSRVRGSEPYLFEGSSPGADRFGILEVRP
ncbi:MAG TPA: galactokinase family protein [Candidatus Hydrogenedentes bacterium]|nr:galactokinase family protein [Candidatus Hydrogenedentota bacterium]HQM50007.1 galactokinase family protein [Candidatus Hydrogenedentota bacterium]